jgi:hypothetical protein
MKRSYKVVDVFTSRPLLGNPVAVILDADGLDTDAMQAIANWTNLSETTFVFPANSADADYSLRIFTPRSELPFAGHPTLGSAHAIVESGRAKLRQGGRFIQECKVGLVEVTVEEQGGNQQLTFALPSAKIDPLGDADIEELKVILGCDRFSVAPHDGLDRPALPRLPPSDDAAGAALHGDADDRRHHSWRPRAAAWLRCERASGGAAARRLGSARSRHRAKIGEDFGYDEINLNVGCPSDRVKDGRFGACLMAEPALVAEGVAAMKRAVKIPSRSNAASASTTRIRKWRSTRWRAAWSRPARCADRARPQGLAQRIVAEGKPRHPAARLRQGLSAEGRAAGCAHHHQWRHRQRCGGEAHLDHVDGVMLGRAAYQEPWRLLASIRIVRRGGAARRP